jgi:succinoglycan biosynthesis protein ExoM
LSESLVSEAFVVAKANTRNWRAESLASRWTGYRRVASRRVSIVVVTFYREAMLARTVRSCLVQRGIDPSAVEIVVVDNSPDATARGVAETLRDEAARVGVPLRFVHEPRPGVSHPRNAGVKAAAAELVAFIDDDEVADPLWLYRMLRCQERHRADIVVGPVFPVFETERASRDPFWRWFYTMAAEGPSGEIAKRGGGTHNCLFVKRNCCPSDEPFDPALGLTGGEDSRFFLSVARRGGRMVWCDDAIVREFVPAARSNWRFALRRRFRENQLLMQSFLWSDPPDALGVGAWMAVGLGQVLLFAPSAVVMAVFHRATAKKFVAKAVGGLGKLIWFRGMTLIGYGRRDAGGLEAKVLP